VASARCSPACCVIEVVVAGDFGYFSGNKASVFNSECLVLELSANFLFSERGDVDWANAVDLLARLVDPLLVCCGELVDFKCFFSSAHDDGDSFAGGAYVFCFKCLGAIGTCPRACMDGGRAEYGEC